MVHVFVERGTGRPARDGMGTALRGGLEKLSGVEKGKL